MTHVSKRHLPQFPLPCIFLIQCLTYWQRQVGMLILFPRRLPKVHVSESKIVNIVELCQAVAILPDYTEVPQAY